MSEYVTKEVHKTALETMEREIEGFRGAKIIEGVLILQLEPALDERGQTEEFRKKWAAMLADMLGESEVVIEWV
ncbi:MAG: hypothetical protein ACD_65C00360G0002 [uncultured bacterium]|nr:MAG: hypothetical protein ACD_65C00360G0002 [uncultured bacterium]